MLLIVFVITLFFLLLAYLPSTPNKAKGSKGLGIKLEEWAINKSKLTNIQKKLFQEKHSLAITHMNEKHEQYLAIQEKESTQQMKYMSEEHAIKMKILEMELKAKIDFIKDNL